jgi:acyl dehydratase
MPVSYDELMAVGQHGETVSYTSKDSILYALGVGLGHKAPDEHTLPFLYEGRPMRTVPSMATVLMHAPVPRMGIDFSRLLHGEQRLTLHAPIPPNGTLRLDGRVAQVIDKGPGKGAVVLYESKARDEQDRPVFTTTTVLLARGDGGIGGPGGALAAPHAIPARAPDFITEAGTRTDQALLYRLNDDLNPLHADPEVARRAGLPVPILHGLCTYGVACQMLLRVVCAHEPARMAQFNARFSAPVFPGDTLELQGWRDGPTVSFRCRARERDVVVLDNGLCLLRD